MRTHNDEVIHGLEIAALQTPGSATASFVASDSGILRELVVAIVSGTTTQTADITVTKNGSDSADVFEVPSTAANASVTVYALSQIAITKGDLLLLKVGTQGSGGTVLARVTAVIRR